MTLLAIDDLQTHFFTRSGILKAVDGVSLSIEPGEVLAVVGESGCGKSVTAFSVLGLVPNPPGRIVGGSIRFEGRELVGLPAREMRALRGDRIGMIFQEPMTSLNPALTVGDQIGEVLVRHRGFTRRQALTRAEELLDLVRVPDPRRRVTEYPHRLSGGMRQRVMIAMAIACEPKLLIADEPTTALDVTVQAQVLDLLASIRARFGMAILLITHDLGVVAETADRVAVMYAGRKVEEAATARLFADPQHPYTRGLLGAIPEVADDDPAMGRDRPRLSEIPGMVPALDAMPPGCRFAPRCPEAMPVCRTAPPALRPAGGGVAACYARQDDRPSLEEVA
ncbi:ABC transporter ATP-binding protein [Methylobacterium aquaticum]|uniref:ABC transporter ATP-binding protein n=1 Tax=Methylobacterium aquaticum TaxID=270351 RepID=UPI003D16855D